MNVTDCTLIVGDNETATEIKFIYHGNENVIIKRSRYNEGKGKRVYKKILVPRAALEILVELMKI